LTNEDADFTKRYLPEIVVSFFVLSFVNWVLLLFYILIQTVTIIKSIFKNDILLVFLIFFPLYVLLFLGFSTWSIYSFWDRIKKIPFLADIIRNIFGRYSPKRLQKVYPFVIVSIIIAFPIIISFKSLLAATVLLFLILMGFTIIFGIINIGSIPHYCKGIRAIRLENERIVKSDVFHNAIIVVHNILQIKTPPYGDRIDELVEYFKKNNRQYILYNCYDTDDFSRIVYNPLALNLWIFGHGTKSSIHFSVDNNQNYSKFVDAPKKFFIGQFHCNGSDDPSKKSLCELIGYFGFLTEGKITEDEIRQAIYTFINIRRFPANKVENFV
jgi:hypothetical protein